MDDFDTHTWENYFSEIVHLLEEADRQYGIANQSYMQYVLERLEICLQTIRALRGQIIPTDGTGRLQWYSDAIDELKLITDLVATCQRHTRCSIADLKLQPSHLTSLNAFDVHEISVFPSCTHQRIT